MDDNKWKNYKGLGRYMTASIPFKDKYPKLYVLTNCKEARLESVGSWQNNIWVWNFELRRKMFIGNKVGKHVYARHT